MQAAALSLGPLVALPGRACAQRRPAQQSSRSRAMRAAATSHKGGVDGSIDGLSSEYCDEFVCTSSPSVEASVRTLAKDLQRANGTWTPIYTANTEYSDPFRKFKGPEGYQTLDFVPTNVQGAAVTIEGMRMLDTSSAEIRWRLTGKLGVLPVDVAGTTEIGMNLLTGRVERQTERWDLSRCSPPAAAAWQAARALWAAKQGGSELGKAVNSTLDSLTSMDDGEEYQAPNPNDPMKFFQQGGGDTFKQDALLFVGVLLLFYSLVQAAPALFGSSGSFGSGF